MILSFGRRYLFIHAPKTGGTSLAMALEERAMKDDIMLGDTPKALNRRRRLKTVKTRGRLWKHATLADIDGLVTPEQIADLFTFTLVRNPWDRIVSYYNWLQEQRFDHPAVALAQQVDFKTFAQSDVIAMSMRAHPAQSYMMDATGAEQCKLYIRLENFDQDAAPLMAHLGFEFSLPHVNKSDRQSGYTVYYDDRTRQAVARACAQDIEQFGYKFGER